MTLDHCHHAPGHSDNWEVEAFFVVVGFSPVKDILDSVDELLVHVHLLRVTRNIKSIELREFFSHFSLRHSVIEMDNACTCSL